MKKENKVYFEMKKSDYRKDVGMRIRQFRKELGLRQDELAEELNFGRSNLARIEKGAVYPNIYALTVFRSKYNLSLDWLLYNQGPMFSKDDLPKRISNYGDHCAEEIEDLRYHMTHFPLIRHAVLHFFLEYKAENREMIQMLWDNVEKESEQEESAEPLTD